MKCANCRSANPDGAKFCMSCGNPLPLVCPNCGTELPANARFCFNCGQQIAAAAPSPPPSATTPPAPPAPETSQTARLDRYVPQELRAKLEAARVGGGMVGERRVITMLFCDVTGSTAAAGQLDPEEWHEIMNGAFEHLIAPVYKYEGTLARLMGDAILAFFGAPIAHEDDPERAVLAGLKILEAIRPYKEQVRRATGIPFDVRVGINTGLVIVGEVGSDLRMEYTAMGDAINLAARMEQTAEPGTVQISSNTHKLVAPLFDFKDLGGVVVKGKDEPVRAFQVLGRKERPGQLRGIEGLHSPLVGRNSEIQLLRDAIQELRGGRGQIVSVMGEAGLGKSRLVTELFEAQDTHKGEDSLAWLEGRSLSYETSTPYAPFIDLFASYLEVNEGQTDQEKLDHITRQIQRDLPKAPVTVPVFLAAMLGIRLVGEAEERVRYLEPPQMRAKVFEAVLDFFEGLAVQRPVVLVLDDVHWIDPTSLELLKQLMLLTDRAGFMIIAMFRPRRQEPSWEFHEQATRDFSHRYTAITLNPLSDDSCRELVTNLLRIDDLPESVRELILRKSEGNPFFLEEMLRSMLDAGAIVRQNGGWAATERVKDVAVPNTLAAVIVTRLDRLDDNSRRVAQTASVIGRQFAYEVLDDIYSPHELLNDSLTELERRELLREKSRLPQRLYMFKHALTQETAYESLLLRQRRELHQRVAECLERNAPDQAADIARHFVLARQPERALPYLIAAADIAAGAYATQEAIEKYRQALEILDNVDDLVLARRAYEGLGSALTFANQPQEAVNVYEEMAALGERRGDVPTQVSAYNKISFVKALRMGQFEAAGQFLEKADQLARPHDKAGLSEMGLIRCMMCTAVADFDGVIRYMDETLELGRELNEGEQMAMSFAHISSSQAYMLQFDLALETAHEGLALCREIGDLEHESDILTTTLAMVAFYQGEVGKAFDYAEEGWEIGDKIGAAASAQGLRMMGIISLLQGDYQRAIEYMTRCMQLAQDSGFIWSVAEALCYLGTAYLEISTTLTDTVSEYHEKAIEILSYPAGNLLGATAWGELGYCALQLDKLEQARQFFNDGLTHPTIPQMMERPRLLAFSARLALSEGDLAESERLLSEAWGLSEAHGLAAHKPYVALVRGQAAQSRGDHQVALDSFSQAESLALGMDMLPTVRKALLLAAALLEATGEQEEADAKRQAARQLKLRMAGLFTDETLRRHFLGDPFEAEGKPA